MSDKEIEKCVVGYTTAFFMAFGFGLGSGSFRMFLAAIFLPSIALAIIILTSRKANADE